MHGPPPSAHATQNVRGSPTICRLFSFGVNHVSGSEIEALFRLLNLRLDTSLSCNSTQICLPYSKTLLSEMPKLWTSVHPFFSPLRELDTDLFCTSQVCGLKLEDRHSGTVTLASVWPDGVAMPIFCVRWLPRSQWLPWWHAVHIWTLGTEKNLQERRRRQRTCCWVHHPSRLDMIH